MKRLAPVLLILCAFFAVGVLDARAQTPVFAEVGLNKDIFYVGDYMYIYLNMGNNALDIFVDAYMSITKPDGTELYAPNYSPLAMPYRTGFHLPGGWASGWMFLDYAQLPSMLLPLVEQGEYTISFWLCAAGASDIITPKSTQTFQIVPCQLDSWVNDNYTRDVLADEEGLWVGLINGVQYIPFDGSRRTTWHRENGPWTANTRLFKGADGSIIAGGHSLGLSIYDSCGWHSILDSSGAAGTVFSVSAIVHDDQGRMWILWDRFVYLQTLSCLTPDGDFLDYTAEIDGAVKNLCLTNDGRVCAVSDKGLHIMYDGSFQFVDLGLDFEISYIGSVYGDPNRNVWLEVGDSAFCPHLVRYSLDTGEAFIVDLPMSISSEVIIADITSDSSGKMWFSICDQLVTYDGNAFDVVADSPHEIFGIAIADDGAVYCESHGYGIQRYADGEWISYQNESPAVRTSSYSHLIGLSDGEAILAGANNFLYGYEKFDGLRWQIEEDDGDPERHFEGVYQGKTGLWGWNYSAVYREDDGTWIDASDGLLLDMIIYGVQEDGSGQAYLLTDESLMVFQNSRWELLDSVPDPGSANLGFMVGHSGQIYLLYSVGYDLYGIKFEIQIRDEMGNWSFINATNLLPGSPFRFGLSESGLLYAGGVESGWTDNRRYIAVIDGDEAQIFWLDELGYDGAPVDFNYIAFDLADRAWISTRGTDGVHRTFIHDPATGVIHAFEDPAFRMIPQLTNCNFAIVYNMSDRSFGKYGTLWYTGYGPTRVNLAPQSRVMIDRPLYGVGESVQVEVYFANYAGSIAVDWYCAIEDMQGNRIYWLPNFETGESSWASVETPAVAHLMVPTDTALMVPFGTITIPDHFMDGSYWWRSGFKRAAGDDWLGLGFQSHAYFCVIRPPTP